MLFVNTKKEKEMNKESLVLKQKLLHTIEDAKLTEEKKKIINTCIRHIRYHQNELLKCIFDLSSSAAIDLKIDLKRDYLYFVEALKNFLKLKNIINIEERPINNINTIEITLEFKISKNKQLHTFNYIYSIPSILMDYDQILENIETKIIKLEDARSG